MTNTENNTKIAKFLGYGITDGHQGKGIIRQGQHISLNKLKFHNDWNWLMEIVFKCLTLTEDDLHEWDISIGETLRSVCKETVYKEILTFIEWYNKNGKQK